MSDDALPLILQRKSQGRCILCAKPLHDGDPKRILTHSQAGRVKVCPEHDVEGKRC